jgi:hypothetical protein
MPIDARQLKMKRFLTAAIVLGLPGYAAICVAGPVTLRDPFTPPVLASAKKPDDTPLDLPPPPVLRAVLFAGNRSMINLGGTMLSIGDTWLGYRLLSVHESEAVFTKDGAKITLSLDRNQGIPNRGKQNEVK